MKRKKWNPNSATHKRRKEELKYVKTVMGKQAADQEKKEREKGGKPKNKKREKGGKPKNQKRNQNRAKKRVKNNFQKFLRKLIFKIIFCIE